MHVFDWKFYIKHHPDLVNAGIVTEQDAILHWENHGKFEGRISSQEEWDKLLELKENEKQRFVENSFNFIKSSAKRQGLILSNEHDDVSRIQELTNLHTLECKQCETECKKVLDEINAKYHDERNKLDMQHNIDVESLKNKYQMDKTKVNDSSRKHISEVTKQHFEELQNINKVVHENLNELREIFENKKLELEEKYFYESELINSNYKSDQIKINDSSRQHIAKITSKHLEELNNINRLNDESSKDVQEKIVNRKQLEKDLLENQNKENNKILKDEKELLRRLDNEFQENINKVVSKKK